MAAADRRDQDQDERPYLGRVVVLDSVGDAQRRVGMGWNVLSAGV